MTRTRLPSMSRRLSTRDDARLRPGTSPRTRPGETAGWQSRRTLRFDCYGLSYDGSSDLGEVAPSAPDDRLCTASTWRVVAPNTRWLTRFA